MFRPRGYISRAPTKDDREVRRNLVAVPFFLFLAVPLSTIHRRLSAWFSLPLRDTPTAAVVQRPHLSALRQGRRPPRCALRVAFGECYVCMCLSVCSEMYVQ